MSVRKLSPGLTSLSPGYYRIRAKQAALMLSDGGDKQRGCVFDPRCTYDLHLKTPLDEADLRSEVGCQEGWLEVSAISPAFFSARKMLFAPRRHALQRFGPGELMLASATTKADLAQAAFAHVEFRHLRLYELDDQAVLRKGWSWIFNAWPLKPDVPGAHGFLACDKRSACVYVHMHYWETWSEIENVLLNDCYDLDLIVTSTSQNDFYFERIKKLFPQSRIIVTENRGRDVGPFIELLRTGVFDHYHAVCKIHGKLSKKNNLDTVSGTRIRRYILACLLADGACHRAVDLLMSDKKIGLAGPGNLLLPPEGEKNDRYIKSEGKQIRSVCARFDLDLREEEIEFFAGTMFWFRPSALDIFRRADINIMDFDPENGAKRNTLQHALERLFNMMTRKAGFETVTLQPITTKKLEAI